MVMVPIKSLTCVTASGNMPLNLSCEQCAQLMIGRPMARIGSSTGQLCGIPTQPHSRACPSSTLDGCTSDDRMAKPIRRLASTKRGRYFAADGLLRENVCVRWHPLRAVAVCWTSPAGTRVCFTGIMLPMCRLCQALLMRFYRPALAAGGRGVQVGPIAKGHRTVLPA